MPNLIPLERLEQILKSIPSGGGNDITYPIPVDKGGTGRTDLDMFRSDILGPMGMLGQSPVSAPVSLVNNVVLGYDNMENVTPSNDIVIGCGNFGSSTKVVDTIMVGSMSALTCSSQNMILIGSSIMQMAGATNNSICIGSSIGTEVQSMGGSVVIGDKAISTFRGTITPVSSLTAIGKDVGIDRVGVTGATLLGNGAGKLYSASTSDTSIAYSTLIGATAGNSKENIQNSVAVGYDALYRADLVTNTTAIGFNAGSGYGHSDSVLIGRQSAMEYPTKNTILIGSRMINSSSTVLENAVVIGSSVTVANNNQIQLGNSKNTTYVYGTVQNRSDARDKTNITDLDYDYKTFIRGLRPRNFQWDMREDYITDIEEVSPQMDEEGHPILEDRHIPTIGEITHDGTHTRKRRHNGFIAQEVKQLLDSMGFDFGGYQDHKLDGGTDTLSLGYEEFIAPMVACMQDMMNEIDTLKQQILELQSK